MLARRLDRPHARRALTRLNGPRHGPVIAAVNRGPGRPAIPLGAMQLPCRQAPIRGLPRGRPCVHTGRLDVVAARLKLGRSFAPRCWLQFPVPVSRAFGMDKINIICQQVR